MNNARAASAREQGNVIKTSNGFKVLINNGRKPIVVRLMNAGSGGRPNAYFRVSIDGKGSFTMMGQISEDRLLTHVDINSETLISDIKSIVDKIK
jgi:hypothetical protein